MRSESTLQDSFPEAAARCRPCRGADQIPATAVVSRTRTSVDTLDHRVSRIVREAERGGFADDQVFCGDFDSNVGLKYQGATVLIRNPLVFWLRGLDLNQRPLGYELDT
jgi:hypothetical protein